MDINPIALQQRLHNIEAAIKITNAKMHKMGELTRNPLGTLTAIVIAIAINISIGWLHSKHDLKAYTWLVEQEQIWATDLGVRIREIIDYDTSRFVDMPAGTVMIGLSPTQTQQYIQTVILTESGGDQYAINRFGYAGICQFGAAALVSVGLVSRQKFNAARKTGTLNGRDGYQGQKKWLNNPENWLIQGGLQTFLDNKQLQIKACVSLANQNIQYGYKSGALHRTDSAKKHAGFAKAAHLVGASKATRWYKYRINSKDGNGTTASTYARQGEQAIN